MEHSQLKILVAEDTVLNQQVIQKMLEFRGWKCEFAKNGREAVEKADQNHYHLILMDIQMPEMDGFEAAQKIRAREKKQNQGHIPIIAHTAFHARGYEELCKLQGMDAYLPKPIDRSELYRLIEELALKDK